MEQQFKVIRMGGQGYERSVLVRTPGGQEVWVNYIDPEEDLEDGMPPQLPPEGILRGELYIEWVITAEAGQPGNTWSRQPITKSPAIEVSGQVLEVLDAYESVWDLGELGNRIQVEFEQEANLQPGGWYTASGSLGLRLSEE